MIKAKKISMAVAGACALLGASVAHAELGWKAGDWDLSFSGNVNGFATFNDCDNSVSVVQGGLACNGAGNDESSIESGLLPSALVFSAKTRQMNMDISVTLGLYPGLNDTNAGAGKTGIGSTSIDMRQNFLTFGDKSWGTIKVGRDLGLFAGDAILSDMTLLGVGSGATFLGGNTTLGRIGAGYIYADWIPQITYMSPSFSGFDFAAGVFQSFDQVAGFSGNNFSANMTKHDDLSFQGKASYSWSGDYGGKVWVSGMQQKIKASGGEGSAAGGAIPLGTSSTGSGFDIGGKVGVAGFELVAAYYDAKGLGTTAIGFDGVSFDGVSVQKRDSDGFYVQGTYKFGPAKVGVSYGESNLDRAGNEAANNNLVKTNESWVFGVYYGITKSLNLVAEYIKTESENQAGGKNKDDAIALGAILFF